MIAKLRKENVFRLTRLESCSNVDAFNANLVAWDLLRRNYTAQRPFFLSTRIYLCLISDVYYHATLCEVTALGGCDGCANCCSANGRVPKTYGSISCSSDSSCASSFSTSSATPLNATLKNNNNNAAVITSNTAQGQVVANLVRAGTLHIEKSRVCFVSEPIASTCKLISSWDLKTVRHFGTTPNEYFCLEIDVADGKGKSLFP